MHLTRDLEQLTPRAAESAYNLVIVCRFAQRYIGGKSVANVSWEELGYGTHLLAETAESVVGYTNSFEAVESASTVYPAPNASYQQAELPDLPSPDGRFDVVVALGVIQNLERPDELVKEAKRLLKQDGMLLLSVPDKQPRADDPGRRRGLYALELRELLEQHFRYVHTYLQGTVAGGLICKRSNGLSNAVVESAQFSLSNPSFVTEAPTTHFVVAVCSDAEAARQENERPYLLLDRDRRLFEECEDFSEDTRLLRDEVRRMQESEAQAFQDTLTLRSSETNYFRIQLEHSEARLEESRIQSEQFRIQSEQFRIQKESLEERLHAIENSRTWRLLGPYRSIRARLKP